MREFWFGFFGSVVGVVMAIGLALIVGAFLVSGIIASILQDTEYATSGPLPDSGIILEIDLRTALDTSFLEPGDPLATTGGSLRHFDSSAVQLSLLAAIDDPRVDGVLVAANGHSQLSVGTAESIARALKDVSEAGKPVIAMGDTTFMESLPVLMILAVSDEAYLAPFARLNLESERSGPDNDRDGFSRRNATSHSFIARERALPVQDVSRVLDRDSITPAEALEAGLVDGLSSYAGLRARFSSAAGRHRVSLEDYWHNRPHAETRAQIAIVRHVSEIVSLEPHTEAMFEAALDDERTAAIILQIGSEYPSSISSSIIAYIRAAQEGGVPVVAQIPATAVGAHYLELAGADRIILPETALLGGIGMDSSRLSQAFVPRGSGQQDEPRADGDLSIYAMAVEHIAEARDLPIARVDELSRGRTWTGIEAVENGLADEIGGLADAVETARALAGIPSDVEVSVVSYPRPPTRQERLAARLNQWLQGGP